MGNIIFRGRRNTVDERYTRPQRILREPSNIDYKKLRKLILSHKLAPCFDGAEDSTLNSDLEECPICFFFYPSLNRSRCCSKGICTECFLQMNPSNAIRPAQCPFCKSSCYAVEYRGAKSQEEKVLEQAEEQKVIEAKIRMQFQESQATDQVTSSNQQLCPVQIQHLVGRSVPQNSVRDVGNLMHGRGIEVSQFPFPNALNERHAEFGLNLDEVMLMEAIWQSIRDRTHHQYPESYGMGASQIPTYVSTNGLPYFSTTGQEAIQTPNSITGGVASVIARMAERSVLQPGTFTLAGDNIQNSQIPETPYSEQHTRLPTTMPHGASACPMGLESTVDSEFQDSTSENECVASCSTTDDSWDSLSAHMPEGSQCSENFVSDEDLMKNNEEIDDTSSCSSVHTISDVSCSSPDCSDTYQNQNCTQLSDHIASLRHQQEYMEY